MTPQLEFILKNCKIINVTYRYIKRFQDVKSSQALHSTTSLFFKLLLAPDDIQPSSWKTDAV